jgi:16S rRNA (cytosine967-C5)-methyltransferase
MTPGARIQAAIELLDQIYTAWQSPRRFPADKLLEQYFKAHRYIGSKDRGAVSELVYWVLRHKSALEWNIQRNHPAYKSKRVRAREARQAEAGDSPPPGDHIMSGKLLVIAAIILRKDHTPHSILSLAKDSPYSMDALTTDETAMVEKLSRFELGHPDMPDYVRLNYPEWMDAHLRESFGANLDKALDALNAQAPTDLRVNTLKTDREHLLTDLQHEGFEVAPTPHSPIGIRMVKRGPVFTSAQFKKGHFEVQDEGSQMVAAIVDAKPGQRVLDFCAGAGGKTLAIAAAMENKGRVLAWDISQKRLAQIALRLRRAGVDNVQAHTLDTENDAFIKRHKASADRVLVDAPCSGTGTWRRNPDLKWRFTPTDLAEVIAVQQSVLVSASRLVKPGGRLIYATCSILKDENERQIEQFLKTVNNFKVVSAQKVWDKTTSANQPCLGNEGGACYLQLTPHEDGVDGFFAAVLERCPSEPSSGVGEIIQE